MIWEGPVKGDLVLRYDNNIFNQRYYKDGFLGPLRTNFSGVPASAAPLTA